MKVERNDIKKVSELATARWGSWVKYVIGAVVGALVAGGVLTVSSCGTTVTVTSDQGMLEVSSSGAIIYTPILDSKK